MALSFRAAVTVGAFVGPVVRVGVDLTGVLSKCRGGGKPESTNGTLHLVLSFIGSFIGSNICPFLCSFLGSSLLSVRWPSFEKISIISATCLLIVNRSSLGSLTPPSTVIGTN